MNIRQLIRQASIATLTSLTVLWGATSSSFGQTVLPVAPQSPPAPQSPVVPPSPAAPPSNETPETEELTQEQIKTAEELAELDAMLLGPWAFLTDDGQGKPTKELLEKAISGCLSAPKFERLDIEPGAARKLPKVENLRGDIIYFRTNKGLQRFETKPGRMILLSEHRKLDRAGRTIWAVRGRANGFTLRFSDTRNRGGKGQFMLENDTLYLRCRISPDVTPTAEN